MSEWLSDCPTEWLNDLLPQSTKAKNGNEESLEERNKKAEKQTLENEFKAFSATFLSNGPRNQGYCFSGSADWKKNKEQNGYNWKLTKYLKRKGHL